MPEPTKTKLYSDRSARPVMLPPVWESVPAALRALPQWVAWELRWRDDNASWAKVPLDVRGVSVEAGYSKAKSNKPRTWTSFERVREAWGRTYGAFTPKDPDGPGFVFRAGGGIVGIDGDKCRNRDTGELTEFGRELMARFPGYWEVSPSGTGIKGVFFGQLPGDGRGRKVDFPEGHGVELYDRERYFAVTGRPVEGATADLTSIAGQLPAYLAELDAIRAARTQQKERARAERFPQPVPESFGSRTFDHSDKVRRARAYIARREEAVAKQGGDNRTFGTACTLVLGFDLTPDQAMPLMCEWNQTCSPPWPEQWLWRKLTQADQKPGPRGRLLHAERPDRRPRGYLDLSEAEIDALIADFGKPSAPPGPDQAVVNVAARVAADLTEQSSAVPDAPPDACALYAAHDIDDEIALARVACPNKRPVLMERDGRPFVCDRDCGNGTACRPCLMNRLYQKSKEGNAYLIRTSVATAAPEARTVYAALLPASVEPGTTRWNTLTNAVRDRGGERCSLLTDDAPAVADRLGRGPDASRFLLEDNKVQEESGADARLWLISLPDRSQDELSFGGARFRRVAVANAMRGLFHAVKTVPAAPEAGTFKPYHESKGWGDKEVKVATSVKALRPSKFGVRRTAKILSAVGVQSYAVRFDQRNGSEPGIGWVLPAARSLAMTLWLGGVGADFALTVDRVVHLARHWLPLIPIDLGKGRRVEDVLRRHVWHTPMYGTDAILDELRAADGQDKAEEAARAEASELYAALRDSYRGRESDATGLLAELLA